MAFKLKPHKRGSKTRQEKLKTAARDNYNKRRATKSAAPAASPKPKARKAAAAPKASPKPAAKPKASTGGPARYKAPTPSRGPSTRPKRTNAKPEDLGKLLDLGLEDHFRDKVKSKPKRSDPPTQGKRIRDKVKSFFSGGSKKNTTKVKNPRAYIGARNDKKK